MFKSAFGRQSFLPVTTQDGRLKVSIQLCSNPWNVKAATKVIYLRKASGTNGHLGHNQWSFGDQQLEANIYECNYFGVQIDELCSLKLSTSLPCRHKDPSLLPQAVCEIQPCCIFAHRSSSDHFYNLCIAAHFMMWTALPLPTISLSSFTIFIKNNLFFGGCVPTLGHSCQCEIEKERVGLWTAVVRRPRAVE